MDIIDELQQKEEELEGEIIVCPRCIGEESEDCDFCEGAGKVRIG